MDYSKKVLMDNIYYLAKKNNITLGKLEELVGLSAGYLSRLNREDNNSNPSIDVVSSFSKQLKVPVDILIKYDLSTLSPDDTYMLQFLTVLAGKTANNEIHWNLIPRDFFSEVMQGDYQHELFEIHMSNYYEYTSRFFDGKIMDIEGDALKVYINKTEYVCLYRVSCSTDERNIRDYYYELYLESDSTEKKIEPLCNALMGDKNSVYFEILDQLCDLAIESTKKVSLKSSVKSSLDKFINDGEVDDPPMSLSSGQVLAQIIASPNDI